MGTYLIRYHARSRGTYKNDVPFSASDACQTYMEAGGDVEAMTNAVGFLGSMFPLILPELVRVHNAALISNLDLVLEGVSKKDWVGLPVQVNDEKDRLDIKTIPAWPKWLSIT